MADTPPPILTIDPARQFGAVCIAGTRITAETIAGMVAAGDSIDDIAEWYEITREQVLVACWWYPAQLRRGNPVIKAWAEWVMEAGFILGGWKCGPLADPPEVRPRAVAS